VRERVIRVAVIDGRELFRRGVTMLLEAAEGFGVVAHGPSVAAVTAPADVVLVDASSPGLAACQELAQAHPGVHILVLTAADDADPFAAMAAGALGLLHKDCSLRELLQGIRVVADGQTLVSPAMTARLVSNLQHEAGTEQDGGNRLTAREFEVLQLVAAGLSNREIGDRLGIAENTAKNHVRNMLEKLNLRTRTEAAMYAVREKLVEP
jgi:DNA-binding NarL/FixJ family response regulator